jgi:hypothetical protein
MHKALLVVVAASVLQNSLRVLLEEAGALGTEPAEQEEKAAEEAGTGEAITAEVT